MMIYNTKLHKERAAESGRREKRDPMWKWTRCTWMTIHDPLSLATDSGYAFFIFLYIKNPYLDLEKILSSG